MNALTLAIVEVCEATAIPEIIGQGDGATNAADNVIALCRVVREQDTELLAMRKEWLCTISDIAKELVTFGFVDESGGDGIVIAVRNALTKQAARIAAIETAAKPVVDPPYDVIDSMACSLRTHDMRYDHFFSSVRAAHNARIEQLRAAIAGDYNGT